MMSRLLYLVVSIFLIEGGGVGRVVSVEWAAAKKYCQLVNIGQKWLEQE